MPLPNWQLFDRLRAFLRKANLFRQDNLFQDQTAPDRIISGGDFIEFSKHAGLLEQTNLQINRLERYKDYDMMDEVGEITLAMDLYADESSLIDPERKHAIIVRSKNKKIKEVVEDFLYNTLLIDRDIRPMIRYLCKYGDYAAEMVPTKNRDGLASLRFINIYNFTRVQTKFGDLVGFYYQDPNTMTPYFLHPWQVSHMRLTSFEQIYHPYGKCGSIYSRIKTPTGSIALRDIQIGDQVFSFDEKTQKPVITRVLDKVLNGKKKTLIIKTKHRSIQVTPEHPLLAIKKDNFIQERVFVAASDRNQAHFEIKNKRDVHNKKYILAQDLKLHDKLILPKFHDDGIEIPMEIGECETNNSNNKKLSFKSFVDVDFAKLMGFLIGDGWINNDNLHIAEGEHSEINQKYKDIIRLFGYDQDPYHKPGEISKYGYFKYCSVMLARTCKNMGLVGRCFEKRIPKWVFVAKEEIKKAFIDGLVDSDGSINIDKCGCTRFQIELTSEELVKDLKVLLDQVNIKCGNISKRSRPDPVVIFDGEEYQRRDSWILYWYDAKMASGDLLHFGKRRTKYDNNSDDYLVESIISIEDGGEVEVGDIQVDSDYHNFIADGVVIHNSLLDGSRKDFKRLRLMEDAALIYRITRAPEKRIFSIPIGQIPSNQIYLYLTEIARQFKKHKFVDPATGQVNERYSPLIQEDDFFLPKRPDGTGPEVSTLPGAQNLDQIEDILYFKKKMIAGLKIPFSRVGIGEQTESDGRSLSSVSPEFAKATQWVQREMVTGLRKVCVVHLALQGYSIQEIKSFDLSMTAASAIDELYRIETWNTRADIIGTLKESGLFPDDWILERFTDMTRDEIDQLQRDNEEKVATQAASQEPAAPEDILSMGEAVDNDDQKLINEYKDYEKRIYGRKIVLPDLDEKPLKYRKDPILENASVEWYVNNNEMDGLPSREENTLLVESTIPKNEIKEVRKQYELLLSYNGTPNENIQRVADSVEEGKQVLSEDTGDQIQESDLPQK